MQTEQPFLIFSMPLDNTSELNRGRLVLYDWEQGHLGRWVATSGLGMYQKIGGWSKQGGGVLPAPYQCNPKFANYWVDVPPLDRAGVKGIDGNAYSITPFEVRTKEGVERSDLMIHRDANVPGSMGCIVMETPEFEDFENVLAAFCQGHSKIKLWVQYDF
jgi:hypothetical protein